MKHKLLYSLTTAALLLTPTLHYAQAPNLGSTVDFVIFTAGGAVENSGISQLTGHVGTNSGSSIGFGNVNGIMHDNDGASAQASADLLIAYNFLLAAVPDFSVAPGLGNGTTLVPGVYEVTGAATLNLDLILDAQGVSNAVFIFKIPAAFSTNPNSKVKLINGAQACNVFWKVEGLVDMAAGTTMRGTVIANNAAINMNVGDTLEGRLLSTAGAISIDGVLAYTPIGCGSPTLTGPTAPTLGTAACFGIFSGNGSVSNSGVTNIVGDVGTNVGLTSGFNPLLITGTLRPGPDGVTAQATADLLVAYNYMVALPQDIELLYPAQFGGNLVLTPHTYVLNGGTTFTDNLYLNAQDNANAVFVIKVYGAFETSAGSKVILINGAQAKNVYWMINGAVDIHTNSIFNGTIVSQAAINLFTGVTINGSALTGVGNIQTVAMTGAAIITPANCTTLENQDLTASNQTVSIYPNPFDQFTTIKIEGSNQLNGTVLRIYDVLGAEVMNTIISNPTTVIDTSTLPSGLYLYYVTNNDNTIQSGKMISQK